MFSETVLIAETDSATLDVFPRVLSDSFPQLGIDLCHSADDLTRKLKRGSYNAVAMNPLFLEDYRSARQKRPFQLLAPLLVTASPEHRSSAEEALETDAFDVVVKPIVSTEAVQSVRLALWQNRLLKLLTAKDRATTRFREHMATFPYSQTAEAHFTSKMATFDRTFEALQSSMRMLLNIEDEQSLFDVAASVEHLTMQRALIRLHTRLSGTPDSVEKARGYSARGGWERIECGKPR